MGVYINTLASKGEAANMMGDLRVGGRTPKSSKTRRRRSRKKSNEASVVAKKKHKDSEKTLK